MRHRSVIRLAKLYRVRKLIQATFQMPLENSDCVDMVTIAPKAEPMASVELPVEILTEIFCLVVNNTSYDSLNAQRTAPWVLGRVCHRWRVIVHTTPKFWSNISVAEERAWSKGRVRRLESMLSKSSTHPLQVAYTSTMDLPLSLLPPLQCHAFHLSTLQLTIGWQQFQRPTVFFDFADADFPVLESLSLNAEGTIYSDLRDEHHARHNCPDVKTDRALFSHAPCLTRLDIQGIRLSHFPLPWSQIKEFRGDVFKWDDLATLRAATHLQEARIVRYEPPILGPSQPPICLASLHHLTLYGRNHPFPQTELLCPNLQTFRFARLSPTSEYSRNMCPGLDTFVGACQLHTLILDVGAHPFTTIQPIIQSCSAHLRVLALDVDNTMAAELYAFLVDDGLTCLTSCLEELYIRDATIPTFDKPMYLVSRDDGDDGEVDEDEDEDIGYARNCDDVPQVSPFMESSLVDMVASRVQPGGCLRELVLCTRASYPPSEEAREVLQRLGSLEATNGFKYTVHWGYQWTLLDHGALF